MGSDKKHAPTIYDVATTAGFSKSTVSLVINGDARVKGRTSERIKSAIAELGYSPAPPCNRKGPKIKRRRIIRHQQVALLFGGKNFWLDSPVFAQVQRSVERQLRQEGWNLIIRYITPDCREDMIPHRLDGALLFGVDNPHPRLMRQLRALAAIRIMGTVKPDDWMDHVTYDNGRIGSIAATYLTEKGHRTMATISAAYAFFRQRQVDFSKAAQDLGAVVYDAVNSCFMNETEHSESPNLPRIMEWIEELKSRPAPPTAIYVSADVLAVGLYHALPRCGLLPGRDIEIVGTNNERARLDCLDPRPASVDIHSEQIGAKAVELLHWRLNNPCEKRKVILETPDMGFT